MKKNTFFGITQGLMWLFLCTKMGYGLSNWQFWIISIIGIVIWAIIYNKFCDDQFMLPNFEAMPSKGLQASCLSKYTEL